MTFFPFGVGGIQGEGKGLLENTRTPELAFPGCTPLMHPLGRDLVFVVTLLGWTWRQTQRAVIPRGLGTPGGARNIA